MEHWLAVGKSLRLCEKRGWGRFSRESLFLERLIASMGSVFVRIYYLTSQNQKPLIGFGCPTLHICPWKRGNGLIYALAGRLVPMDLYSRRIVGWELSDNMQEPLVREPLEKALLKRRIKSGLIIHSDRGGQYLSNNMKELVNTFSIDQSGPPRISLKLLGKVQI